MWEDDNGTHREEVKFQYPIGDSLYAKAVIVCTTDVEERKHGEQTGLETLVVHASTMIIDCWTKV